MNEGIVAGGFWPHILVRHTQAQTLLARLRPGYADSVEQYEQPILLDAGEDMTGLDPTRPVRLLGYYTTSPVEAAAKRGLVMTLHGWEGCSHSVYNMAITHALLEAGYDVFRLNLRDHGPGLHMDAYSLNHGVFMGTLIDEALTATQKVAEMAGDLPFYIVGASMGGNFASRLAIAHSHSPIHNLAHVIGINPAVRPGDILKIFDSNLGYRYYFRKRWLNSLQAKQRHFPETYNFEPIAKIKSMQGMSEWLLEKYSDFDHMDEYYEEYAVPYAGFADLKVQTTLITAANDLIIPVEDFYKFTPHPLLKIQIHKTGGHVGYVDLFPFQHQLPGLVLEALDVC